MTCLRRIYLESIGLDYDPRLPGSANEPLPLINREEGFKRLREELGDCQRCPLARGRRNLVFGGGNPEAELVFVGEAPGRDEDIRGVPFVGRAGELLDKIIAAMGLSRENVYICNVIKCRPPGNRDPFPSEIEICRPFLERQLEILGPRVICALGSFAAKTLLETEERISLLRGKIWDFKGISLIATYHPSYLLRNPQAKREAWVDIQKIMEILGLPVTREKGRPTPGQ